jgi:ferritin-like metal-binding protein YciE
MKKHNSGRSPKLGTKKLYRKSFPLKELFIDGIRDLYRAEKHLVKSPLKMVSASTSTALIAAVESHLSKTKGHVARIEQIFLLLREKPYLKSAMPWGINQKKIWCTEENPALKGHKGCRYYIGIANVEHSEIAPYNGLYQLATTLGLQEVAGLLEQTLSGEILADSKLSDDAGNKNK